MRIGAATSARAHPTHSVCCAGPPNQRLRLRVAQRTPDPLCSAGSRRGSRRLRCVRRQLAPTVHIGAATSARPQRAVQPAAAAHLASILHRCQSQRTLDRLLPAVHRQASCVDIIGLHWQVCCSLKNLNSSHKSSHKCCLFSCLVVSLTCSVRGTASVSAACYTMCHLHGLPPAGGGPAATPPPPCRRCAPLAALARQQAVP